MILSLLLFYYYYALVLYRFKRFVVPDPEILKHTLTGKEDFMILACDGLWDVMSAKDAGEFVRNYRTQKKTTDGVAQALALEALELKSGDNVSVVVVFFNEKGSS
jgi:serine/threonine protein phosphatase PrpC